MPGARWKNSERILACRAAFEGPQIDLRHAAVMGEIRKFRRDQVSPTIQNRPDAVVAQLSPAEFTTMTAACRRSIADLRMAPDTQRIRSEFLQRGAGIGAHRRAGGTAAADSKPIWPPVTLECARSRIRGRREFAARLAAPDRGIQAKVFDTFASFVAAGQKLRRHLCRPR